MARTEEQKKEANREAVKAWQKRHTIIHYATNDRTRSLIKAEADRQGMSMNDYIKRAVLNQLKVDREARSEEADDE